jgi:hypothetical protein
MLQLSKLLEEIQLYEGRFESLHVQYSQTITELQDELKRLTKDREGVYSELRRLEGINDNLVGKHSKHHQQLQDESINLPDNMEVCRLYISCILTTS